MTLELFGFQLKITVDTVDTMDTVKQDFAKKTAASISLMESGLESGLESGSLLTEATGGDPDTAAENVKILEDLEKIKKAIASATAAVEEIKTKQTEEPPKQQSADLDFESLLDV